MRILEFWFKELKLSWCRSMKVLNKKIGRVDRAVLLRLLKLCKISEKTAAQKIMAFQNFHNALANQFSAIDRVCAFAGDDLKAIWDD